MPLGAHAGAVERRNLQRRCQIVSDSNYGSLLLLETTVFDNWWIPAEKKLVRVRNWKVRPQSFSDRGLSPK